jgi:endonuclease YncB( thermonuclease family)
VRLTGIDAPEKRQPFGDASRQHLAGLVFGREVEARCPKRDRYGRWLCKLRVDGRDANFAQLTAGMAWHYKAYGKDQGLFDFTGYALAELEARYRRRGLWADPRPQAPWAFRRARREAAGAGFRGLGQLYGGGSGEWGVVVGGSGVVG